MNQAIQFETPENVRVSYRVAGQGTRFVAWIVDSILVWVAAIVIFIFVLIAVDSAGLDTAVDHGARPLWSSSGSFISGSP